VVVLLNTFILLFNCCCCYVVNLLNRCCCCFVVCCCYLRFWLLPRCSVVGCPVDCCSVVVVKTLRCSVVVDCTFDLLIVVGAIWLRCYVDLLLLLIPVVIPLLLLLGCYVGCWLRLRCYVGTLRLVTLFPFPAFTLVCLIWFGRLPRLYAFTALIYVPLTHGYTVYGLRYVAVATRPDWFCDLICVVWLDLPFALLRRRWFVLHLFLFCPRCHDFVLFRCWLLHVYVVRLLRFNYRFVTVYVLRLITFALHTTFVIRWFTLLRLPFPDCLRLLRLPVPVVRLLFPLFLRFCWHLFTLDPLFVTFVDLRYVTFVLPFTLRLHRFTVRLRCRYVRCYVLVVTVAIYVGVRLLIWYIVVIIVTLITLCCYVILLLIYYTICLLRWLLITIPLLGIVLYVAPLLIWFVVTLRYHGCYVAVPIAFTRSRSVGFALPTLLRCWIRYDCYTFGWGGYVDCCCYVVRCVYVVYVVGAIYVATLLRFTRFWLLICLFDFGDYARSRLLLLEFRLRCSLRLRFDLRLLHVDLLRLVLRCAVVTFTLLVVTVAFYGWFTFFDFVLFDLLLRWLPVVYLVGCYTVVRWFIYRVTTHLRWIYVPGYRLLLLQVSIDNGVDSQLIDLPTLLICYDLDWRCFDSTVGYLFDLRWFGRRLRLVTLLLRLRCCYILRLVDSRWYPVYVLFHVTFPVTFVYVDFRLPLRFVDLRTTFTFTFGWLRRYAVRCCPLNVARCYVYVCCYAYVCSVVTLRLLRWFSRLRLRFVRSFDLIYFCVPFVIRFVDLLFITFIWFSLRYLLIWFDLRCDFIDLI